MTLQRVEKDLQKIDKTGQCKTRKCTMSVLLLHNVQIVHLCKVDKKILLFVSLFFKLL
jgi:hypothetical protein